MGQLTVVRTWVPASPPPPLQQSQHQCRWTRFLLNNVGFSIDSSNEGTMGADVAP